MEVAGLTIGAVSLATLFNNAVDCFEYVQIGREFGRSFQTSLLKLDAQRLRLTRWGEAIGLSDLNDASSLRRARLDKKEIEGAEMLLGQILELFSDTEKISNRYKARASPGEERLILYDATTDLEGIPASLHRKMRQLAINRQRQTGLRQKVRWALYEEKHFKRLIEDLSSLVHDLVGLFPALESAQRQLCEIEISEMDTTSLPLLQEVIEDQDELLSETISNLAPPAQNQSHVMTFSGNNNSGMIVGHNTGTISGFRWGGAA